MLRQQFVTYDKNADMFKKKKNRKKQWRHHKNIDRKWQLVRLFVKLKKVFIFSHTSTLRDNFANAFIAMVIHSLTLVMLLLRMVHFIIKSKYWKDHKRHFFFLPCEAIRKLTEKRRTVEGKLERRDITSDYSTYQSETYAPLTRHGVFMDKGSEQFTVKSKYLSTYRGTW